MSNPAPRIFPAYFAFFALLASARAAFFSCSGLSAAITVIGAIYLTIVCVLPEYMIAQTGVPLFLGGTSLLIVVNVTVDTISQIQSHLLAHQYGDLIKKAKLKGRLR